MFKFIGKIKPATWLEYNMTSLRDFLNNCYFYRLDKDTYETTLNGVVNAFNAKGLTVSVEPVGIDGVEVVFSVYYNGTYMYLSKIFAKARENYVQKIYKSVQATDKNITDNFKVVSNLKIIDHDNNLLYKNLQNFFARSLTDFDLVELNRIINVFLSDGCTAHVKDIVVTTDINTESALITSVSISILVGVESGIFRGSAELVFSLNDAKVDFNNVTSL